jgi:pimeloyl-ACP methyl ester carboxylesterase
MVSGTGVSRRLVLGLSPDPRAARSARQWTRAAAHHRARFARARRVFPARGWLRQEDRARDVQAVIDAEAVTRYHLVGADMGASVAFPLAMEHEDQVRSFVFISSALAGVGLERLYDYSTIGVNAWYWTLFQHETFGPMLTAGRVEELLTTWAYRGSALNADAISDEIIKEYLSHYATTDGWRAALQYYMTLGTDAVDNCAYLADGRLLRMPTLGIDGEQDGRLSTATLAQVAGNVRGTLIPRCKHWIAEEQPKRLAAVLLDFFAATAIEPGAGPHV